MLTIDQLLANPPALHVDQRGAATTAWQGSDGMLRYLDRVLFPGARTLETGAGLSTLVFAINGAEHTVVVPDPTQAERILHWGRSNGVPMHNLRFELERSEDVLPTLEIAGLDVVLIDGAHGFPSPFIDWYYAARHLRVGGTVMVDDTQIWTGAVLRDFLRASPDWEIEREVRFEFAAARRASYARSDEWLHQPYVLRRSFVPGSTSLSRRAFGWALVVRKYATATLSLVRRGKFGVLRDKVRRVRASR